jgi:hypothetical protein
MTKKRLWLGMLAITLVAGMVVLSACTSTAFVFLNELSRPDNKTAIVYIIGDQKSGVVWDGEKPVGNFMESTAWQSNIEYVTTPGPHYFMFNTFNWITTKADLQANKRYYIKIETIPNPIPFSQAIIVARVLAAEDVDKWMKKGKNISFSDEWRAKFAQGKDLKEAQDQLQKARNDKSLTVTLTGKDGI